jgi:hypothetical protein
MSAGFPNLVGQEDVYSAHTTEHVAKPSLAQVDMVVLLERLPGALARLFALLCLFELVPQVARTELCENDVIRVQLQFVQLPPERLQLLLRKICQLTECLDVQTSQCLRSHPHDHTDPL